jgi:hypothetical protein
LSPDIFVRVTRTFLSRLTVSTEPPVERGTVGVLPSLGYFRFSPRDRIANTKASEFLGSRRDFASNGRHLLLSLHRGEIAPSFRPRPI